MSDSTSECGTSSQCLGFEALQSAISSSNRILNNLAYSSVSSGVSDLDFDHVKSNRKTHAHSDSSTRSVSTSKALVTELCNSESTADALRQNLNVTGGSLDADAGCPTLDPHHDLGCQSEDDRHSGGVESCGLSEASFGAPERQYTDSRTIKAALQRQSMASEWIMRPVSIEADECVACISMRFI